MGSDARGLKLKLGPCLPFAAAILGSTLKVVIVK